MNLYEMLHHDHEKAETLFELLEASGEEDINRREELFFSLSRELETHTQAEEKFLYSLLRNHESSRELTLESFDDHKEIRRLLAELDAMDKGTPEWTAKCRILREAVARHVDSEERDLFPLAKKAIDDEEAAGIAEDIESFKEEQGELEAY